MYEVAAPCNGSDPWRQEPDLLYFSRFVMCDRKNERRRCAAIFRQRFQRDPHDAIHVVIKSAPGARRLTRYFGDKGLRRTCERIHPSDDITFFGR